MTTLGASIGRAAAILGLGLFALLAPLGPAGAQLLGSVTSDETPLLPADTSSPRATLASFQNNIDQAFAAFELGILSYFASNRLYFNAEEERLFAENRRAAARAIECLDLSELPASDRAAAAAEDAVYLLEILERIQLPPSQNVPDAPTMAERGATRWRLPGTRIEIALVREGARAGEWLFSPRTLARLDDDYAAVKRLPYKPGTVESMFQVYNAIGVRGATFYDQFVNSPVRLAGIVPFRWLVRLPDFANWHFGALALWKWVALGLATALGLGIVWLIRIANRRLGLREGFRLATVLPPLALALASWLLLVFATDKLRIGGVALDVLAVVLTVAMFLAGAWAVVRLSSAIADALVTARASRRLDAQLIRLMMRLLGFLAAMALLLEGADELGLPAYSLLAGLGISGLAVALAARESLANLFASIILMIEKPFRLGQWVKVSDTEGIVVDVGFRSTRIRTFHNSLVSIPNSEVAKSTIDNFGARTMRRQRFFVQVLYSTPADKIEAFVAGLREMLAEHPRVDKEGYYVRLHDFGESGLGILLYFYLHVDGYAEELEEREKILLGILELAERLGVEFAFPTRTLHLAGAAETPPLTEWATPEGSSDKAPGTAFD